MPKLQEKAAAAPAAKAEPDAAKKATKKAAAKPPAEPVPPDEFATLAEQETYVNGLWMGNPKTGKTTALAHMANLGRVVFVNAESGIKRRPLQERGVKVENVLLWPNPAKGEKLTFEALEQLFWRIAGELVDAAEKGDPAPYAGAVWDSITDITKTLLDNEVDRQFERLAGSSKARERFFIDRGDYGVMGDQVRLLLRRFRDLPCHFGCSALMRRDLDDDGAVIYRPAVIPSLANDLGGYVDVICVTDVYDPGDGGDDVFRGLFRPSGKYQGGDRYGVLPKRMPDPTFDRVFAYIEGKLDAESDPVLAEAHARIGKAAAAAAEQEPVEPESPGEAPQD